MRRALSIHNTQNISNAWRDVFREILIKGVDLLSPLTLSIFLDENNPSETLEIRDALNNELVNHGLCKCQTTANTIFPQSLWNRNNNRSNLYQRYESILPRIKNWERANQYGTYFERLISYDSQISTDPNPMNQLERIIDIYQAGVRRRSAFQAAIFDPNKDLRAQRRRGFPCLQHIIFTPNNLDLSITGIYATQFIFDRAYGNFLGLLNLGLFMAHEMELNLSEIHIFASRAEKGEISKSDGNQLLELIEQY